MLIPGNNDKSKQGNLTPTTFLAFLDPWVMTSPPRYFLMEKKSVNDPPQSIYKASMFRKKIVGGKEVTFQ